LGLLVLLRAGCRTIWCVDSEADAKGAASQLRDIRQLAFTELDVAIDIDLGQFKAIHGLMGATHAIGTIHYPSQSGQPSVTGTLIVIKLGLSAASDPALLAYLATDCQFPHHKTFTHMAFGPERMEAYRKLGFENAVAASADFPG